MCGLLIGIKDKKKVFLRKNIANIKSNDEAATFKNTIIALETSQEDLNKVVSVYFHLFSLPNLTSLFSG